MYTKINLKKKKFVFTSIHLSLAGESSLGSLGKDGIVLAGDAGNSVHQHLQTVGGSVA